MTKRFADYLSSIGMAEEAYIARVEQCLALMTEVAPERLQEILVEDVVQEDGTRQYIHLNAFTANYILGVSFFLTGDTVEMYRLTAGVTHLSVSAINFDFKEPTAQSRILVNFSLAAHPPGGSWALQASGVNAAHAWRISKERVRPQLEP
jgi:hypothetical protein